MQIRIIKSGPGCVHRPGSLLKMTDKRAKHLIAAGFAVPDGVISEADLNAMALIDYKKPHRPLVGEKMVSIIIPVYNQANYLRLCLDSIKSYTKVPYEIIIIDNGSDADTKALLTEYDIKVITNKKNMGFPFAVNQGIINSRGRKVLILNSDTVVTPGWLEVMVKAADSGAGIVGPTTNYSTGPQCIRNLQSPEEFASIQAGKGKDASLGRIMEIGRKMAGSAETFKEVSKLSGFCMLIDRRVISEIGGFDYKAFGMGTAEEMDLEDRAQRRGWKLVWAKGAYVHHFGHKTLVNVHKNVKTDHLSNHDKYLKMCQERDRGKRGVVVPMFDATPVMFPTWDRLAYSQQSFDNLLSVTPNAQFVMYDDGSGDGTREWIMEQDDPRIVGKILRKERQGIDAQMDLFFSITPGVQFVAKIDNDTIMSTGWLERLMEVAVSAKLDVIAPTHFKNDTAIAKYLSHKKRREVDGCVYYLNHHVGGLVVIRRSWLDLALDAGRTSYYDRFGITPGGWTHFQEQTPGAKAFYPDVYAELLDLQRGPGADYPKYNQKLNRERVVKYGRPPEAQ